MFRQSGRARDDLIEHSAQTRTIDCPGLHGEADDAASELIHHDHHPMRLEGQRFTTKEIDAPETILRMSEEAEPGPTVRAARRPPVFGEHTSHHILVDLNTEYEGDLLSDTPAAEARVPPLHLDDRRDQFWARPLRTRSPPPPRREEQPILSTYQGPVKHHERRRLQHDGRTQQATRPHQPSAKAGNAVVPKLNPLRFAAFPAKLPHRGERQYRR